MIQVQPQCDELASGSIALESWISNFWTQGQVITMSIFHDFIEFAEFHHNYQCYTIYLGELYTMVPLPIIM